MKVTVFTQVYNARPYLAQCVESVLNQTFSDFEYILIDDGSTDGSPELIREYAQKDGRIRLFAFPVNKAQARWLDVIRENGKGEYITNLDADDWLEPNYLERLVSLAGSSGADIISTGSLFHREGTGQTSARTLPQALAFDRAQFAPLFAYYHVFFRTNWAKLIRMETFLKAEFPDFGKYGTMYGWDTVISFSILRKTNAIYMDSSVLHHYRLHQKSVSYRYDPQRFFSDAFLYDDAIDFLSAFGPVSEENQDFIALVYANAVNDTAKVIYNASMPSGEKISEYRKIVEHPATRTAFSRPNPEFNGPRKTLRIYILKTAVADNGAEEDVQAILSILAPKCAPAVSVKSIPFLKSRPELLDALANDDPDALLAHLLELFRANEQSKKFGLYDMIRALSAGKPLLLNLDDKKFLRRYGDVYLALWRGQNTETLNAITGRLLDGEKPDEPLLQLYLSLAALENQIPAFLFGKAQLAKLYLRRGDRESCRSILDELAEMGVEENEEIAALRAQAGNSAPAKGRGRDAGEKR